MSETFTSLTDPDLYRQMLEASPSAIILTDATQPDMPIIYVNPAFEHLTGYRRDEVTGKNPRFLQSDNPDPAVSAQFQEILAAQTSGYVVVRNYRKDGSLFWNEMYIAPLRNEDGQVVYYIGIQNDVTARKNVEASLRENEARYRTITENFPNGLIALYDHDLRYTFVNGMGLKEVGLTPADLEGKRLRDVFPPDVYQRDEPALLAALNGETTDNIVSYGDEFFRVMTLPVRGEKGEIIAGMVMSQNITAQKRAEDALRLREQEIRALIDNSPDFIARLDRNSRHLFVNPAYAEAIGLDVDDIIGKTNREIGVPEDIRRFFDSVRRWVYDNNEEQTTEFDYPTVYGKRHYHLRLIPEHDANGNVETLLAISRDITGRKKTEDDLQEAHQRYKLLADLAIEGIAIHSGGYIQDANRAFLEMFGYTLEELDGQQAVDLIFAPESRETVYENIRNHYNEAYEAIGVRKDGSQFPAEVAARQLSDTHRVASVRDITARKEAQQREIEIALERERVQLLTTFMQAAAHEFKTPLATISTGAHLMALSGDPERRKEKAAQTQQQVQRISDLVDMLLLMTDLESASLQLTPVAPAEFVRRICNALHTKWEQIPIHVIVADENLPMLHVDTEWITQALTALLDNARRFGATDGEITVRVTREEARIVIAVQDGGAGISKESQPYIFETFWRDDKSHSTPGFGLGLSLARKIARLHGGDVELHATGDTGSTFHLWIPLD